MASNRFVCRHFFIVRCKLASLFTDSALYDVSLTCIQCLAPLAPTNNRQTSAYLCAARVQKHASGAHSRRCPRSLVLALEPSDDDRRARARRAARARARRARSAPRRRGAYQLGRGLPHAGRRRAHGVRSALNC